MNVAETCCRERCYKRGGEAGVASSIVMDPMWERAT